MAKSARQTIPSPYTPDVPKSGARINYGHDLADAARKWMENNEEAFKAIYCYVKSLQAKHVSGRLHDRVALYCTSPENHIVLNTGFEVRFKNDLWTAIARYLVLFDPSLLNNPVKLRRSDIDFYGLWPISWMEVVDHDGAH